MLSVSRLKFGRSHLNYFKSIGWVGCRPGVTPCYVREAPPGDVFRLTLVFTILRFIAQLQY